MSYRCDICGIKVPPGQPRLAFQVRYPRDSGYLAGQIRRELACCEGCHLMLDTVPLSSVKDPYYLRLRKYKEVDTKVVTLPEPPPPRAEEVGRVTKNITL